VRSLRPSNNLPGILPLTVEPDERRRHIYKVFMEKSNFFVSHEQIHGIIGDEPWTDSEINCLCNVASDRKIWLTLGSKRKCVDPTEKNIGDWVTVSNHGNLFPWAQVKEIDFSKNLAKVKWEISCTTYVVEIANLQLYSTSATSKWKRIKTDFIHHYKNQRYQTTVNDEKLGDKQTVLEGLVPIQYYSLENTLKFYAEGLVKNLLHMLRLSEHDVSVLWDLANAPLHSISKCLCYAVPKIVCNHYGQVNSTQKCLWIHFGNNLISLQPKNEIVLLHIHQEYTMKSSNMSFSNTALGQQQKCCLQPCCGNMAG
jgi:hypothetical protein